MSLVLLENLNYSEAWNLALAASLNHGSAATKA